MCTYIDTHVHVLECMSACLCVHNLEIQSPVAVDVHLFPHFVEEDILLNVFAQEAKEGDHLALRSTTTHTARPTV